VHGGERKIDAYQIGTEAADGKTDVIEGEFTAYSVAMEAKCADSFYKGRSQEKTHLHRL